MIKTDWVSRLVSGIVYVGTVLYAAFTSEIIFNLLMMTFSALCFWEFLTLSKMPRNLVQWSVIFIVFSMCIELFDRMRGKDLTGGLILFPIACFVMKLFSNDSPVEKICQLSQMFFAWVYIGTPFFMVRHLYTIDGGKNLIMGLFILIWINDTLAYLVGQIWGKRKLLSFISPKKTVEGFLGGVFFCMLCGFVFYNIWGERYWMAMGLIVSVFGTLGDLVESVVKRAYGVKDSSRLFPGHGGFLDRLDSFVFVIPVVMAYLFY